MSRSACRRTGPGARAAGGRKVSAETFPSHSEGAFRAAYTLSDRARIALGPRPGITGNPASRIRDKAAFKTGCIIFAVSAPLNLLLARLAPGLLPGLSQPGLFTMLAGSALLCLPAGLANGYAAGAALRGAPGFFYAAEAAGAAAAGLFTLFYYRHFPGLEAAAALAAPALVFCAVYPLRPFSARRLAAALAAALALGAANFTAPEAGR